MFAMFRTRGQPNRRSERPGAANLTVQESRATVSCMQPSLLRGACLLAVLACASLACASCTVNQTLVIAQDGTGTIATHAEVSALLRDYLGNLAEISGSPGSLKDGRIFDAAAIRGDFGSRPGIVVRKSATPAPGVLDLELEFDSMQDLLNGRDAVKDAGAVSIIEASDTRTLRLHLDRTTWGQLARLLPPLRDPLVAELGPQASGHVTESDYLAMVQFSVGDAAPALLKKSFLTLIVRPQGEIVSQAGGTVSEGAVTFRIPMLRILVLDRPLDYSLTWKR
jgi:hypothetical protein